MTTKPERPQMAEGAQLPDAPTITAMLAQIARVQATGTPDTELLPKRLSPSRANDYKTCPQMFAFKTLTKLSSPPTEATVRGTITHTAFERTFDHPAGQRTPELTKSYIRPAWEALIEPTLDPTEHALGTRARERALADAATHRALAPCGSPTEQAILEFAERMVDNWYAMERVNNFSPAQVTLPDGTVIDGRELHVEAPLYGMTMHGYIDRLDTWQTSAGPAYAVSDFKTGKVPGAGKNYRAELMERIEWDSFFQLRVYAALLWEQHQVPVSLLRLLYVATGDKDAGIKTLHVTQAVIDRTHAEIRALWSSILRSARTQTWQPRVQALCSWCYFAPICPAFEQAP